MSKVYSNVPENVLKIAKRSLLINATPKFKLYNTGNKYVYLYDTDGENIYLPFHYSLKNLEKYHKPYDKLCDIRKDPDRSMGDNVKFGATLRKDQVDVKDDAIKLLNKNGSCIISSYTGFGKTIISIYIACLIGVKTLIAVNRITLMNQWEKSIKDFCGDNVNIQVIRKSSEPIDPTADFYIINCINISKKPREEYKNIPMLVVDECHLLLSAVLGKSLTHISPKYLLGLSATPYREDGLNVLFDLFFGSEKIFRKLKRVHHVRAVHTGWVPEVEYGYNGKVDWNNILNQQANHPGRNKLIVELAKGLLEESDDNYVLIVCKRVGQINVLEKMLKDEEISTTSLVGSKQDYDEDARVLIGTLSKVGTGFDHRKLNSMILATDVKAFFIQTLGRIFRKIDTTPIVVDIIDKDPILRRHYKTREKVYKEVGGIITDISSPIE